MTIFGQLDAAAIPSNAFKVDAGEYSAEVTKAFIKTHQDGNRQLIIEYTITDPDSEFDNNKVAAFFNLVDPNLTNEDLQLMDADNRRTIRRNLSNLKKALCGDDNNEFQPGLNVDPDDLNRADWSPESLVGKKVNVAVYNYGLNNEKSAVKWANVVL